MLSFTYAENFIFPYAWMVKSLKNIFKENYPIVATEISHKFIFPFYSESFLRLA